MLSRHTSSSEVFLYNPYKRGSKSAPDDVASNIQSAGALGYGEDHWETEVGRAEGGTQADCIYIVYPLMCVL